MSAKQGGCVLPVVPVICGSVDGERKKAELGSKKNVRLDAAWNAS